MAFHAIVNVLQVEIQEGGTMHEVYYDDNAVPN
jgi:hypothetical protein